MGAACIESIGWNRQRPSRPGLPPYCTDHVVWTNHCIHQSICQMEAEVPGPEGVVRLNNLQRLQGMCWVGHLVLKARGYLFLAFPLILLSPLIPLPTTYASLSLPLLSVLRMESTQRLTHFKPRL